MVQVVQFAARVVRAQEHRLCAADLCRVDARLLMVDHDQSVWMVHNRDLLRVGSFEQESRQWATGALRGRWVCARRGDKAIATTGDRRDVARLLPPILQLDPQIVDVPVDHIALGHSGQGRLPAARDERSSYQRGARLLDSAQAARSNLRCRAGHWSYCAMHTPPARPPLSRRTLLKLVAGAGIAATGG